MCNFMAKFYLIPFASNQSGSKIFCKLVEGKRGKDLLKGHYDYNIENFFIDKWYEKRFKEHHTKEKLLEELKEILLCDYDWEFDQDLEDTNDGK